MKDSPFPLPRQGDDEHSHFNLGDIHFPDHHGGGEDTALDEGELDEALWKLDNVELVTVGVDIGSSTSHVLFARLYLQRLTQSLSSRFAVVRREVLHRSPILLTPYRQDGLIDAEALERFVDRSYQEAGLRPADIDTGAVILTGVALERANSRAVAELFARSGGKFVCASAGHNLEAILSAHGSGAVALSRQRGETLLHIDIGGGTSKLTLLRDGEVLANATVSVGGRLVAYDDDGRVTRLETGARLVADEIGVIIAPGERVTPSDRRRLAKALIDVLVEATRGGGGGDDRLASRLMLTEPLAIGETERPTGLSFSGGVSEYLYQREGRTFGDLAPELAASLGAAIKRGELPGVLVPLDEGIRATVIGASQFSVQLSGNTIYVSNQAVLPLRNLPVVHARLTSSEPSESEVEQAIRRALQRLDLPEGEQTVAIAFSWRGEPYYRTLRALAGGIAAALPGSRQAGLPLVVALHEDVGRSLGGILAEELGVRNDLVAVDGLELMELDYVDLGEVVQPANVVPVVVKSLAFGTPSSAARSARALNS